MRKIILCCVYIIISIISIFAQSNYKKGYIITLEKDTVYGWIDFRTDHANSELCKFKHVENELEKIYHPGEIDGYRFTDEGKYYVSRTVVIDSLKRTVFLEFLVQGLLNLYYSPEGNGYYFFENKNGEMISTTKNPDEIIANSKLKIDNRYKGVISYVLRDDLPLATQTFDIGFNRESIIKCTKEYHEHMCDSGEKCIIFENDYKKKFTKLDFTAFSGLEFNDMKLDYINLPKMLSFSPIIGIGLNISSPRLIKSVSLMCDVTLSKIAGACDYSNSLSYFQYTFSGMKSNFSGGLEYIYHKGKVRPTINAGFSYCYLFNIDTSLKAESYVYENVPFIENSWTGIKAGLGVDYQINGNQFIIVRLLYSRHSNFSFVGNTYQFKLGYKF